MCCERNAKAQMHPGKILENASGLFVCADKSKRKKVTLDHPIFTRWPAQCRPFLRSTPRQARLPAPILPIVLYSSVRFARSAPESRLSQILKTGFAAVRQAPTARAVARDQGRALARAVVPAPAARSCRAARGRTRPRVSARGSTAAPFSYGCRGCCRRRKSKTGV